MKLKNILSGICLMAGLFSACTSEELVDNSGAEEGKDTSLSLVLTTGEPVTKAATGYTYATADEIKISNCVVAVFKMDGTTVGDMIGKVEPFDFTDADATYNDKPAYSLKDIPAKTGKVRILVVANATNSDYTGFTTWQQFEDASTDKALVENDLVKVGWLDKELVAPVTGTIAVPLAQLSAKVKLNINTSDPKWTYTVSKVTVEKINDKSDLILSSSNSQKGLKELVLDNSINPERLNDLSFYTYENPLAESVKITIEGTLAENGGALETKKYSIELNKTVDNARLKEGLCHGTLYNINGNIDVATRTINFSWDILPWSTTVREVSVDIIKPKFLVVKDTEMTMPNMTSISTAFSSSSTIDILNVKVNNGTNEYKDEQYDITWDKNETSGTITISTNKIPQNFIPKYITFTVKNEDGISQDVKVVQYPPLYVTSKTSDDNPSGGNNQNNKNMYMFNVLVANFSDIPYPDDRNNVYEYSSYWNYGKTGETYTDYLRDNAQMGYPETQNGFTVDDTNNNKLISPNFMLASQHGTNTGAGYSTRKAFCDTYTETTEGKTYSDWRMPTLAELYLIDVLQNVKRCEVKKILEGKYYWSAREFNGNSGGAVMFMDPRVDAGSGSSSACVRCVRDIK